MAYTGPGSASVSSDLSGFRAEGREPGARRKKLAGYLKAANELRQSYFQGGEPGIGGRLGDDEQHDSAFPDAAVIRSGNEEMVLFPSYARKHTKVKPAHRPDEAGNDEDYWRREWDRHESDKAIVDVDVRGWLFSPQKGPTTRRQRLMIGLARQLSGIPAVSAPKSNSTSREASPTRHQEEDLIAFEAEKIVRQGNAEAELARRGAFSETPGSGADSDSLFGSRSRNQSSNRQNNRLSHVSTTSSEESGIIAPLQKRASWAEPSKMSNAELAVANAHLLARLKPFMANPLVDSPVSAFFYNDSVSRQRTVHTDSSGHFTCRAALDFVPTHVRVLAGEKLSATEEVNVTPERGVSMISDIDDTIKHSAITSGAREIFRNAFIRDLGDLTIEGVREWYTTMHDMGVQMHYVSNSPWQMYPVLTSYFKMANLPRGSFHLKAYTGMLQGIFEPVAERKKSSLDKILRDFPDRKFILVGDSGEADLEVYTDVVLDNPGRVLGVFIRDVTTPVKTGYFDPSNGSSAGNKGRGAHSRGQSGDSLAVSKRLSRPGDIRDDDTDLRAAVAASLADMEEETRKARRSINPDTFREATFQAAEGRAGRPQLPTRPMTSSPGLSPHYIASPESVSPAEEDLIDFSEEKPWLRPSASDTDLSQRNTNALSALTRPSAPPRPPSKPQALRSPSPNEQAITESGSKRPPPRPRKPSSAVQPASPSPQPPPTNAQQAGTQRPSPLSQVTRQESTRGKPALPARPKGISGYTKEKLSNVYNSLPSPGLPQSLRNADSGGYMQARPMSTYNTGSYSDSPRSQPPGSQQQQQFTGSGRTAPPPIPPPRRIGSTSSFSTVGPKKSDRYSGTGGSDDGYGGAGSPGEAGLSKKEFMWQQRLQRARAVMDRQGVTLRTWRVGSDVADVCVRLAEMSIREAEKEEKKSKERV